MLKLQYIDHLMQRTNSVEKDSDTGKDWGQEEKGMTEDEMVGWHHWLDGWVWASSRSWWWTGKPGVLQSMGLQIVEHDWATELNWCLLKFVAHIWMDGWLSLFFVSYYLWHVSLDLGIVAGFSSNLVSSFLENACLFLQTPVHLNFEYATLPILSVRTLQT